MILIKTIKNKRQSRMKSREKRTIVYHCDKLNSYFEMCHYKSHTFIIMPNKINLTHYSVNYALTLEPKHKIKLHYNRIFSWYSKIEKHDNDLKAYGLVWHNNKSMGFEVVYLKVCGLVFCKDKTIELIIIF